MVYFRRKQYMCLLCLDILVFPVLVHSSSLSSCNSADPCSTANTTTPFESYARSENCPYESTYAPCDRYMTPTWYTFDDDILTYCPGLLSCGAIYPCWMNGSLPGSSDGVVTKTVCKVGFQDCCIKEYSIKIKHCGSYYAYCLPALDGCPERFCFGSNGTCEYPTTQVSSTTESLPSKLDSSMSGWLIGIIVGIVLFVACVVIIIIITKKSLNSIKSFNTLREDNSVQMDSNSEVTSEGKNYSNSSSNCSDPTTLEINNSKQGTVSSPEHLPHID